MTFTFGNPAILCLTFGNLAILFHRTRGFATPDCSPAYDFRDSGIPRLRIPDAGRVCLYRVVRLSLVSLSDLGAFRQDLARNQGHFYFRDFVPEAKIEVSQLQQPRYIAAPATRCVPHED